MPARELVTEDPKCAGLQRRAVFVRRVKRKNQLRFVGEFRNRLAKTDRQHVLAHCRLANEIGPYTDLQEPFPNWASPSVLSIETDDSWQLTITIDPGPV